MIVGMTESIDNYDIEDCLVDFMETHFNVELDDNSAKEVSNEYL